MEGTLDDLYLEWLYSQVGEIRVRKSSRTYWTLLRHLYSIPYAWLIPNDDNRAEDGKELRNEWARGLTHEPDESWMCLPCSFLELLIALSRRLAFETESDVGAWFWHLLGNLELSGLHDRCGSIENEVIDRVHAVMWRTYDVDGRGGLFPLRDPKQDQRCVEIWYQMSAYVLENE